MPKVKSPPVNLDQYLKGREHHYVSYEDGARMCGLPYWGFVKMAKEAEATWALRKTSMVDMNVVEKYIEENCVFEIKETKSEKKEIGYEIKKKNGNPDNGRIGWSGKKEVCAICGRCC